MHVGHDMPYKASFAAAKHWKCHQKITFLYRYAVPILGSLLSHDHVLFCTVQLLSKQLNIIHSSPVDLSKLKDTLDPLKQCWRELYNYGLSIVSIVYSNSN